MLKRLKTQELFTRLSQLIPGGVNSPVRACQEMGQLPMIVDHGIGDQLIDVDGHAYIDYCCSWGALIHGHAHPKIVEEIQKKVAKGTTFGVTTAIEEQIAQEVISVMGGPLEKIRFVSSGTEATMSAVRLARGFTNRPLIVKFSGNYHGHADFFLVKAGSGVINLSPNSSSAGIPSEMVKHTLCLPYNDIEACREVLDHPDYRDQIAAVILEPIAGNIGVVPAKEEFIQFLRKTTEKIGALLIFDEVITGFRVALKGAQDLYRVKPDLVCLGKIIGGGFPAAAFGGRQEVMNCLAPLGAVYQAGTLSGNPIAMEAGFQALKLLQQPHFYAELQRKVDLLLNPIEEKIKEKNLNMSIQRVGSMFTIFFGKRKVDNLEEAKELDSQLFARFFRELFNQNIYIPPSPHEAWFISQAHTDDHLIHTKNVILNFLKTI